LVVGTAIANLAVLPDTPGVHCVIITAVDDGNNTYKHTHVYTVLPYSSLAGYDKPIAYYRLGDPTGTFMKDSSTFGHDGEYKNGTEQGPEGVSGDHDHARRFTGADGYGYVNGISAPRYQMTLEAWVDPDDASRDQSIVGHGDGGEIYLEGGVFKFRHGPQNDVVSAGVGPGPHEYTQVVGTWDGVDLRIYVDGQLKGTTESNRRPSSVSTFYIGFGEVKQWFAGAIDEVAYYDIALDPNRVYQHFLADPPPSSDAQPPPPPDHSAPNTTITSGPAKGSTKRRVSFRFSSSESGSSFQCSMDGAPMADCSSPYSTRVKPGRHTFSVAATDSAGNADQSPAQYRFRVKKHLTW
jgi:hypothetical protein